MNRVIIDLTKVKSNIEKIKNITGEGVKVCAVVKANAYSMGAKVVAKSIQDDVHYFAVATIKEGIELRQNKITKPILLLGVCSNIKAAAKFDLCVTCGSISQVQQIIDAKVNASIHIKVNTGMNRYGTNKIREIKKMLELCLAAKINVLGVYTHLAHEKENRQEILKQVAKFLPFKNLVLSFYPDAIVHAAASGSLPVKEAQFDMVRPGKALYGGTDYTTTAFSVFSNICSISTARPNSRIGYGGSAVVCGKVGVVPIGYYDCVERGHSNKALVKINGKFCPIVGNVCMDCFMVKLGRNDKVGDTVQIFGSEPNLSVFKAHKRSGVIVCQMLCNMSFARCKVSYIK